MNGVNPVKCLGLVLLAEIVTCCGQIAAARYFESSILMFSAWSVLALCLASNAAAMIASASAVLHGSNDRALAVNALVMTMLQTGALTFVCFHLPWKANVIAAVVALAGIAGILLFVPGKVWPIEAED
jgi:hypothetical protein